MKVRLVVDKNYTKGRIRENKGRKGWGLWDLNFSGKNRREVYWCYGDNSNIWLSFLNLCKGKSMKQVNEQHIQTLPPDD